MYTVIILGIVIAAASVMLLLNPRPCFEFGGKYFLSSKFQYGVGIVSLVLAVMLFYASSALRFPTLFEIIALFSAVGGMICLVLPASDFKSLVSWELRVFLPYGRVLGVWYGLIAGFLIYAAL